MVTVAWTDLNVDGRRLENVIKWCYSMIYSEQPIPGDRLGYVDRLVKLTHEKREIIETIMNVRNVVKKLEKIQA